MCVPYSWSVARRGVKDVVDTYFYADIHKKSLFWNKNRLFLIVLPNVRKFICIFAACLNPSNL